MDFVTDPCRICKRRAIIDVDERRLAMWRAGFQNIQDALPELNADERELLLTGIHPHCWERLFGDDE